MEEEKKRLSCGVAVSVECNHMIRRCLNSTALAILLPALFFLSTSKLRANIYISHQCLSNEESESDPAVPSSCQ